MWQTTPWTRDSTAEHSPGSTIRRWLDTNGAFTWAGAAIGLAMVWLGMILSLPM